jgi:16S rRNA (guanine527-N7)-methyltransferase
LNILDELCLPLVKLDGYFITLKGRIAEEELKEANKGIQTLGGKVVDKKFFTLSSNDDQRCNIYIQKIKNTPQKYPRAFGKIKKKPL